MSTAKTDAMTTFNNIRYKALRYALGALLPLIIVLGYFFPLLGYFLLACMFSAIFVSFFKGRYWCYWACPRGIFYDEYLSKISLKKKIPVFFKHTAFRILWIGILMTMLTFRFIQSGGNVYAVGKALVMILAMTTAIGIILGMYYNTRIWCMFCPVGTMSNWFGKGKKPVKLIGDKCTGCSICYGNCPMEINASDYTEIGYVNNGDCIKCGKCVQGCPQQALNLK